MPRNLKSRLRLGKLLAATLLLAASCSSALASDDIPSGFQPDRYQSVWIRNPFTLVTPVVEHVQPKFFDKLILVSWLNDGGKDVVLVENSETNELEKVTKEPNEHHLRLLSVHRDADPGKEEVVLSDGNEQGSIRFRTDMGASSGQSQVGDPAAAPGAVVQNPGVQQPVQPGVPRQVQRFKNGQPMPGVHPSPQPAQQLPMPQLPQTQAATTMSAPRASEVRRKRITAPPVAEQPVGEQTPGQNAPTQPQTQ
jgi:hypothetical protein